MANKEAFSAFTDQEVRLSNEKSGYSQSVKCQITRRTALALTSALYLGDGAVSRNTEATVMPTSTPTPVSKEAERTPGISIPMPDQQTLLAISAFGSLLSGLGLFATAGALLLLRRQAKAGEDTARATKEAVEATKDATALTALATNLSIYENLMTRGDAINATFLEHPELYNQLFETPHVGPESIKRTSDRRRDTQVLAAALRLADFFEISLNLKDAIPKDAQDSWERYMKTSLRNSETLRNLIKNTPWYGEKIKQFNAEVEQEMEREATASVQRERRFQRARRLMQPILNILRKR